MKKFLFVVVLMLLLTSVHAQVKGSFVDIRDGHVYKTVLITIKLPGDVTVKRTWMATNLKYETEEGSYCYKDESAYCHAYGRLYTYKAAAAACPDGWHLPTIGEWDLVIQTYGGRAKAGQALQKGGESGLDLLPGGFGDPGNIYKNIGTSGNYWDSEKQSARTSGLVSLQKKSKQLFHSVIGDWHRNSCRCVKDYDDSDY